MKFIILLIIWFITGIISIKFLNDQFNIFNFLSALIFFILTIIIFLKAINIILTTISNVLFPKKRYREEKKEYSRDNATEHITVNHPEYIGLLTKIDKKRIAEEYLESLKKEKKHGKNK